MAYIEKTRFYQNSTEAPTKTKFGFKASYIKPKQLTWAEKLAQKYEGDWFEYKYTAFWFSENPKHYTVKLVADEGILQLVSEDEEYISAFYTKSDYDLIIILKNLIKISIIKTRLRNTIHR
jgi:hypothetical protein